MKLTWRRQTIRVRHTFATSQGAVAEKQTLVVTLTHEGVSGWGEATPSNVYGQDLDSCEAALERAASLLQGDPFRITPLVDRLLEQLDDQRAAVCAVDSALHDWAARRLGVPVWRLLGLDRPSVQTAFTLGVATPAETDIKLREAVQAGFPILKVKVGTAHDEENLRLIRSRFSGQLWLDANQAWAPGELNDRLQAMSRFQPALIEQPCPAAHDFTAPPNLSVPLVADESCQRPEDLPRLVGRFQGVNIKLAKCGGIRSALQMIAAARTLGLRVMLGCFVSSSLAIAPALAIASLADYHDLDGALLLERDTFGGIRHSGAGRLEMTDGPGLGLEPVSGED